MRLAALIVTGALLTPLAACGSEAPPAATSSPGASLVETASKVARLRKVDGLDYVFYPGEPMKPAYRTTLGPPPLKADQYDDQRYARPDRYAITVPPPAGVRGMVEWEPMKAIVMQFPGYMGSYTGVTNSFIDIARHSLEVAEVWFIVDTSTAQDFVRGKVLEAGVAQDVVDAKLKFLQQPIDSIWFIDSGPLPIVDETTSTMAFADFRYYHERALDDGIPTFLGRALPDLGMPAPVATYRMPVNVEGGTYQTTTDGICITGNRQLYYMSCDLGSCDSSIRFAPLDEIQTHPLTLEMKKVWGEYAGCKDVIIVNSITDDGTGHIDMFLKIVDDQTILVGEYREPFANQYQTQNAARMDANAEFLEAYKRPDGTGFTVPRLVMPGHRQTNQGAVPFTYINSTFVNGLNLWPAFTYPEWEASRATAQAEWEAVMPTYEHIWIPSEELSFWSGAIHCVTRTIPDMAPGEWVADGACQDGACAAPEGGYTGECSPNGLAEEICWGPEWLCTCNDCTTACDYEPGQGGDECGAITYTGCCDGNTLVYCEGGALTGGDCPSSCGWDASSGWYDCELTGEDPTGANPRSCDEVGQVCEPDCAGRQCGDDGCGGECGTCDAATEACEEGQCVKTCTDACTADDTGCDGEVAWLCSLNPATGCTQRYETDCEAKGEVCDSGLCIEAPARGEDTAAPDAGPTEGDTSTGGGDAGPGTPDGANGVTGGGGGGGGCQGSGDGSGGALALLALGLVAVLRRRGA